MCYDAINKLINDIKKFNEMSSKDKLKESNL